MSSPPAVTVYTPPARVAEPGVAGSPGDPMSRSDQPVKLGRVLAGASVVLTTLRRLLKSCCVSLKSKTDRPWRHEAPPLVSPSTKTSLVPSGENAGTIIAVVPSPHALG